jgi:hypothetical protein
MSGASRRSMQRGPIGSRELRVGRDGKLLKEIEPRNGGGNQRTGKGTSERKAAANGAGISTRQLKQAIRPRQNIVKLYGVSAMNLVFITRSQSTCSSSRRPSI